MWFVLGASLAALSSEESAARRPSGKFISNLGFPTVLLSDLNSDGEPEIGTMVTRSTEPRTRGYYVLDGASGRVARHVPWPVGFSPLTFWPVGDLDGDLESDLVLAGGRRYRNAPHWIPWLGTFTASDGTFTEWADGAALDLLGRCLLGDVDADAVADLACLYASRNRMDTVRCVVRSGRTGDALRSFELPFPVPCDRRVSLQGILAPDQDADGVDELVVGIGAGSLMHTGLYSGSDGTLLTRFEVANPDGRLNASQAASLSIVPDLDGDGGPDLLISGFDSGTGLEPFETASRYAGFVAAFRSSTGEPLWTAVSPCTDAFGTGFGEALALLGDLNGDGACEIATAGSCQWQPGTLWVLCGATGALLDTVSVQHAIGHALQELSGPSSGSVIELIAGPKQFAQETGFVGRLRLERCATDAAEQEGLLCNPIWMWTVTGRDLLPE